MTRQTVAALIASAIAAPAIAQVTIDFDTEDDGITPLVNGQHIEEGGANSEFGNLFELTIPTSSRHLGGVIFDTNKAGPNAGGPDPDLIVDLGNALTLQSKNNPAQSSPGVFNTPNDSRRSGSYVFDFLVPGVELLSLTLIDVDHGSSVELILTDRDGLSRTYDVPANWTHDPAVAPLGYGVLDFTTVTAQFGEGAGGAATASEDLGFNPLDVAQLRINQSGSGAIDNLTFVPTPGTLALLAPATALAVRRRR